MQLRSNGRQRQMVDEVTGAVRDMRVEEEIHLRHVPRYAGDDAPSVTRRAVEDTFERYADVELADDDSVDWREKGAVTPVKVSIR